MSLILLALEPAAKTQTFIIELGHKNNYCVSKKWFSSSHVVVSNNDLFLWF